MPDFYIPYFIVLEVALSFEGGEELGWGGGRRGGEGVRWRRWSKLLYKY